MTDTEKQQQMKEVIRTIKKMINLNSIFYDSVRYNSCECYDKFSYVSLTMGQYIWKLVEYFNIEL